MISHSEAKEIVDSLGYDQPTSLAIRGVAWLESQYGSGWKSQGIGSNNWGAITAGTSWRGPVFEYGDSLYDENTGRVVGYTTKFRKYPTAREGARNLAEIMLKSNVVSAIKARDLYQISKAMRDNGYYTGVKPYKESIKAHHSALKRSVDLITESTGEPNSFLSLDGLNLSPELLEQLLALEPFTTGEKEDDRVLMMQELLVCLGHDISVDGIWGNESLSAWKSAVKREYTRLKFLVIPYD